MGIVRTWNEISESAGEGVGSTIVDTGQALAGAACDILSKYPNAFPLAPYARGFVKGACGDRLSDPPEEEVPFSGGQCSGVEYTFVPTVLAKNRFQTEPVERTVNLVTVVGRVDSVEVVSADRAQIIQFLIKTEGNSAGFTQSWNLSSGWEHLQGSDSYAFPTKDGSPDACGDPPGSLPPDPQTDPADFAPTVTINQYDSGGNVTSTANYEIDLSSADLTQFDFSVDLGGIQVQLDIGGISIGGGGEGEGIKPLRDVSFPEVDCGKQKPFDEEELEKEELEEEELETEEEERLAWVAIAITQLPIQGKTVLQKNALDNDYFAGYLAFTVTTEDGNFQLPPEPVKKSNAIFKAPIGATGFRAYSVNGAKLKATIYREKVEVKE